MHISGNLTPADAKRHIPHTFIMPEGATRLAIAFHYTPHRAEGQRYTNQISLSLFDPNGSRGARHNNRDQTLTMTEYTATPGYLAGVLPAGEWQVVVDTHRITAPVEYTLDIEISKEPVDDQSPDWSPSAPLERGPGWYRGDLHGHTLHSDGSWDVPDFVAFAKRHGLDFVTLTDHNTVSGLRQFDSLTDDDILTMGGMELTTYYGHALALGTRQWQEWRVRDGVTMVDLARAVMQSGALFIIAHPKSEGDPKCTGCDWQYDKMMPGNAPAVEIWNGPWAGDSNNEAALQLFYEWLNAGYRLVATAGTDIHGELREGITEAGLNVVYAQARNETAILEAVRAGHLYLSSGPVVEFTAALQSGEGGMMGDRLPTGDGEVVATWRGCDPTDEIRLVVDGQVRERLTVRAVENYRVAWPVDARQRWCSLEIRAANGEMKAVTNPIFFGQDDAV